MEVAKSYMSLPLNYLLWIIFAFCSFVYMVQGFTCIFWIASLLIKSDLEENYPTQLSATRSQRPFISACWVQHESLTAPSSSP